MKVLLLGGGGREHALAYAISLSPLLGELFTLPGNPGTAGLGTNIPGDPADVAAVVAIAKRERIDLVVVGPEDPLAAGVCDALQQSGIRVFGPTAMAAQLESDKAFAKQLMRQYAVPTADARIFEDYELARHFIASRDEALVVKAAGLAKGKGVLMCADPAEALLAAERMLLKHEFGAAGKKILVEERLEGREVSLLALIDGRTAYLLEPAQDYKRLRDRDEGPNTGGMGAICPAGALDDRGIEQVQSQILIPLLDALVHQEIRYCGLLYLGLMLTPGGPKVLEFNCRFGDPETQAILPRLDSDLLEAMDLCVRGRLDQAELRWKPDAAVNVVLAARDYPEAGASGVPIYGVPDKLSPELCVFHAGTKIANNNLFTHGGRVLSVTALGETLAAARERAYACVSSIRFDGMQFRRDIGGGE